jgi:hypothetical protein
MAFAKLKRGARRLWLMTTWAARSVWRAGAGISHWATIAAVVVAALTCYYGYQQFRETQDATRRNLILQNQTLLLQKDWLDKEQEARAQELYIKYSEAMTNPDLRRGAGRDGADFNWRDNLGIMIAESIFILRRDDQEWRATVSWMLDHHTDYLKKTNLNCDTYDKGFIELVKESVPQVKCVGRVTRHGGRESLPQE